MSVAALAAVVVIALPAFPAVSGGRPPSLAIHRAAAGGEAGRRPPLSLRGYAGLALSAGLRLRGGAEPEIGEAGVVNIPRDIPTIERLMELLEGEFERERRTEGQEETQGNKTGQDEGDVAMVDAGESVEGGNVTAGNTTLDEESSELIVAPTLEMYQAAVHPPGRVVKPFTLNPKP